MSVFGNYSHYYNLLYQDKDYQAEANFIANIIKKHKANAKTILNLGCGTGKHDFILVEKGYEITGIDVSKEMLDEAKKAIKISKLKNKPDFIQGDIRTINIDKQFDVVTALFHVVNYMTSNDDLDQFFQTAKKHLKPGGLLFFDFWYGPAVLTIKPEVNVKRLEDENLSLTRIAEPKLLENENIVEVNYDLFIKDKKIRRYEQLRETHRMRYFSLPEIAYFAQKWGLEIIENNEWLIEKQPSTSTWGVYCVLRKI